MSGIVISYRREDTEGSAGRLYDRLVERYGRELVFMDFYSIGSGEDWGAEIDRVIARSSVLLALIGPRWASATDQNGRRWLEVEGDYVRREIRTALQQGIHVVPVLVQSARMIESSALPADLAGLGAMQAIVLDSWHYDRDVERLSRLLDAAMDVGGEIPGLDPRRTAVAAFVGCAERGPIGQPWRVTQWAEYLHEFGRNGRSFLPRSVYAWFCNGGGACYIVRVGDDTAPPAPEVLRKRISGALLDLLSFGEVTILAAPDVLWLYEANLCDLEFVRDCQIAMIAHCGRMLNRVSLLDGPRGLSPQQFAEFRERLLPDDAKFATLYYPWIVDSFGQYNPPSGVVAGMWAGSDAAAGVWAPPANRPLQGVNNLEVVVGRHDWDLLQAKGINVLLQVPGRGIVASGARTLGDKHDSHSRDLATVRLAGALGELVRRATSWAAFERSNKATWRRLTETLEAILQTLWQQGAFAGERPSDAFFVKCDDEVNVAEVIDSGVIQAEFGFAPKIPGYFVKMQIEQPSGDVTHFA
ncbi:hypothetical protein A5784_17030 [Mycobacterium sp. 852013-50091_SCH5140682]|uniref:TIR domain-containing protein n=1 Tax=Mycobacterium sp. 852013-50091_SCH5140682 TaxID=1834109 RepID=UPI0007E9DC48|nr:TIR domain-containing protein [Mycobacterium sp. 852013-50091_SCH5140682]OBC01810.1 hypothetical protein A5784_17030 [Mycobacterium sp. 852013-50091_SCH5140682]